AAELAAGALPPQRIDPPVAARHEPLDGTIAGATGAPAGMATALDGDHGPNLAVHPFRRSDPLSLRLHVATPDRKAHAVVLHTSVFTIESDPQGFELLLEEGHLHWRVVHCWPGSAAAIRTTAPFPIGRFVDVVATWDGSSRAAGLALHLDGVPVATEVVRDGLAGLAATRTLQVGFRDRDVGLAGGRVDDLSLFDRALTALECAELHAAGGGGALAAIEVGAWRAHAVAHAPAVVAAMARARAARAAHDEFHDALPELMVMAATPHPRPAFVLLRGRYDAPDHSQPVAPDGALDALLPFDPAWPHDRLGLALWCSDPRHPLVARVAVNRLFAQCFGRGLVETQENFGLQGAPPVQRELLDLLAVDFIESGFRVQALLRRLLLSATFRQESGGTVERHAVDPRNELLARGPALRLTAEMVRDQALHAAGLLNPEVGGRSVRPWQPPGLWEEAGASGSYTADTGPAAWRRSLYTFRKRTAPPPSLLLFDAGSREQCQARRLPTNTPLQALALQNDRDFVVAAVALARRAAVDPDPLGAAFLRLVSRPPRPDERAALERFLARERERFAGEPER
ncbi:MAG: DUF1553 domain-containing protein, partial [Planctomycetes bacterium]|nr:DUF1553 domain-containing protein [Planctomycetota bacterium]